MLSSYYLLAVDCLTSDAAAVAAGAGGGDVLGKEPQFVSLATRPLWGGAAVAEEALHAVEEGLAAGGVVVGHVGAQKEVFELALSLEHHG